MKNIVKLATVLLSLNLVFNLPVTAETSLQIDYENTGFTNKEISLGKVKVIVDYKPINYETDSVENSNLKYKIYYDNVLKFSGGNFTDKFASVSLKDLDNDKNAEVIVETYSGGAHCCTNNIVYLWQLNKQEFKQLETGEINGGGTFQDLNKDGKFEFTTIDNNFLYAFSSYAGSYPPSLILTIENGDFKNVTSQFPQYLKAIAWDMFKVIKENQNEGEINGVLAGYVAQKILLGQYEEGWKFMLANYDKTSDWGLEIYDQNSNVTGKYANFPAALKAFLIETGYLDKQGKPIKNPKN
jgi:hypothetical protein